MVIIKYCLRGRENKVIFFKIRNVKLLWEYAERTIDILRWIADVQNVIFQ